MMTSTNYESKKAVLRQEMPVSYRLSSPLKPTITLSILEHHLQRCRKPRQFAQIHAQTTVTGLIADAFAASRLLSFTASHLDLDYSRRLLLRQIPNPNPFTWNTLMRTTSSQCCLHLYRSMLRTFSPPDNYTHPIVLRACALRSSLPEGQQVHAHVFKFGFGSDVYAQNNLISFYSACGHLADARKAFDTSPVLDSVSWNSILAAYVGADKVQEAAAVFERMPERNIIAANSMIALFGRRSRVGDAWELFDGMGDRDVVTWTAMISCYEQNEMFGEALGMFGRMRSEGVIVDGIVMVSVLSVCARRGVVGEGKAVHGLIVRAGLEVYINIKNALMNMYSSCGDILAARRLFDNGYYLDQISWNSMISGYLKCGLVKEAEEIFHSMPHKDVVSWSTMISGYARHGLFSQTLELYEKMQVGGTRPDETTLVSVISACTHLSALEQGQSVHDYIQKNGIHVKQFLGTALVDMYMKFGFVGTALDVFNEIEERNVSAWNAAITGLAMNGLIEDALQKFMEMERQGVEPNEITFVGVLGACRHAGLVDKGRQFFDSMQQVYKIVPNIKHYGCMVDLLGRAGLLREAEELIESMPMAPDVVTWGALLAACGKHGNIEIGERVGRRVVELEPQSDWSHVLLSNNYASKGMWNDVMELWGAMKQRGVMKTPGYSLIESSS